MDGNMKQRFVITGGSGFLGINLTRKLLREGHDVLSIDRVPFEYPERERVNFVHKDIRALTEQDLSMQPEDIVVHAAAALPRNKKGEIFSVDVGGTKNVIDLANRAGVKRFIHISTTAVYGVPDKDNLVEEDPLIGVGPYGEAKIEAERIVEAYRDQMIVTVLRPKSFIGPERLGVFAILYDWALSGTNFPIPGKGDNRYQYLDVEDLCDMILLSSFADRDRANDTFNVGAKEFATFKEDFQSVLDKAGFGKRVISIPAKPAIWALRVLDRVKLSPLYPWVYETAVKNSFVSIEKAEKILGFNPKFSNSQSLARNFDWYVRHQSEFLGRSGKTHRVPWSQGVLRIAKLVFR